MGASYTVLIVSTLFWGTIGGVLPFFVPRNENRIVTQTALCITSICCYLIWLFTYMVQMNPLIGPHIDGNTLNLIYKKWPQFV